MSTPIFYQGNINIYIGMNPWDTMSIKSNKKRPYKWPFISGGLCLGLYIPMFVFTPWAPFTTYGANSAFACSCQLAFRTLSRGLVRLVQHKKKRPYKWPFISGGRAGTRTLDPLIKSQLLYQLSYASRTILSDTNPISAVHRTDG